jgi:Ca2+-binding EF-hand superfamily protein
MKILASIITCSTWLALAATASAQSSTPSPAPSTATAAPQIKDRLLRCYDLNGNRKLSPDERREYSEDTETVKDMPGETLEQKMIAKWDANEDGLLSDEEITTAQKHVRARVMAKCIVRFKEADADKDDVMSADEFALSLNSAESQQNRYSPEKIRLFFSFIDKDKNQSLSLEEFVYSIIGS